MKSIRRISMVLIAVMISCVSVIAQESDGPRPDRWRGLVLDESTPEDAIKVLGKPASDKMDRLQIMDIDTKWVTRKQREKIFRKLQFKGLEGIDKAELSFLDGKLVLIQIDPEKNFPASAISRIYGIAFTPKVGALDVALEPAEFERNQGKLYPKTYPSEYTLLAVSANSFIGAKVDHFKGEFFKTLGGIALSGEKIRDTGDFPGNVARVQLVSRKLENKDGADVLK